MIEIQFLFANIVLSMCLLSLAWCISECTFDSTNCKKIEGFAPNRCLSPHLYENPNPHIGLIYSPIWDSIPCALYPKWWQEGSSFGCPHLPCLSYMNMVITSKVHTVSLLPVSVACIAWQCWPIVGVSKMEYKSVHSIWIQTCTTTSTNLNGPVHGYTCVHAQHWRTFPATQICLFSNK